MKSRVRLLLITDPRWSEDRIATVVEAAARVPGFAVQLRDRSARSDDEVAPLARRLREITARHGALLVVNRRFDLARRVGADGVHAPIAEMAASSELAWWRSAPAHSSQDVHNARIFGLDAVLVSPIFATPDKGAPRGLDAIRQAREIAPALQVIALGGVDTANAASCFEAGASGVAVVRALLDAEDPAATARAVSGVD